MAASLGGALVATVNSVNYNCDPGPTQESYDRKYQRLEEANGTRFNTIDYYEGDSECKWNLTKTLEDSDGTLFTLAGLGATVGLPVSTTVVYNQPSYTRTITNCMVNDVEFTLEHGKPTMLAINGLSTSPPAETAGYGATPPTITTGNLLYWRDMLTFFTKAAASAPGRRFRVKISHNLYQFYGVRADGLALPTSLTPTEVTVEGDLDKLMVDDADFALYLAACQAVADVGLTAKSFCGGTPKTLTLTAKNCIYSKASRGGAVKEATVETFGFMAKNLAGANPLVCTLV